MFLPSKNFLSMEGMIWLTLFEGEDTSLSKSFFRAHQKPMDLLQIQA
ncbi:hypothetical protein V6Z12_A01G240200 [Gossypium hirsutum]